MPTRQSRSSRRWGSWQEDAWVKDQTADRFIDPSKLQPVNLQGRYFASRGPLAIPPSEQGQPVVFTSGGPSQGSGKVVQLSR